MMSSQSKRKFSPTFGLLFSTINKNAGVIILMSLAMLIFCPGIFLTTLSKSEFNQADAYTLPEYLDILYGVTGVVSCALICVCNYVNLAYLYKKQSSDVFHSLPLTRAQLLFSRVAAGFIGVLIPVTLGYASLSVLSFFYPTYAIGTLSQIASAYLVNILYMLAASAYSLIFIIGAGSAFDLILSFFGFNTAVLVVGGIIHALCDKYLSGYSSAFTGIMRIVSPVYFLGEKAALFAIDNVYSLPKSEDVVFAAIIFAAVFFAISAILYNFRKAERGGQAYAYKFIYIICAVLAGICGGYALSEIFVLSADTKELSPIGIIFFIVGAIITTVVYGAVTNRGFKRFKKSIVLGVASALVYGVIAIIVASGAFGFEKRIPEKKDISSVVVDFDDAFINFNDADKALKLHKAIIEKKADDEYLDTVDTPHTYVRINYNLDKDGKDVLMREYFVDKVKIKKELFDVYSSDERFTEFEKGLERVKGDSIELFGGKSFNDDTEYADIYGRLTSSETKELLSVYKRELKAVGEEFYSAENQTKHSVINVTLTIDIERKPKSFGIFTTDDFPETNAILNSYIQSNEDTIG